MPESVLMEAILGWISRFGPAGLFGLLVLGIVGLPVPDETLLVLSGSLIARGRLQPVVTCLAAFAGSSCGMSISYYLGRSAGQIVLHRYGRYVHLTQDRIDLVNRWFHRMGHWLLTVGYFIPGVRHFTAFVAGMSGLEFRVFGLYAFPGAAIWIALFIGLGYVVGERWQQALAVAHRYLFEVGAVVVITALAVWWIQRRRRAR